MSGSSDALGGSSDFSYSSSEGCCSRPLDPSFFDFSPALSLYLLCCSASQGVYGVLCFRLTLVECDGASFRSLPQGYSLGSLLRTDHVGPKNHFSPFFPANQRTWHSWVGLCSPRPPNQPPMCPPVRCIVMVQMLCVPLCSNWWLSANGRQGAGVMGRWHCECPFPFSSCA